MLFFKASVGIFSNEKCFEMSPFNKNFPRPIVESQKPIKSADSHHYSHTTFLFFLGDFVRPRYLVAVWCAGVSDVHCFFSGSRNIINIAILRGIILFKLIMIPTSSSYHMVMHMLVLFCKWQLNAHQGSKSPYISSSILVCCGSKDHLFWF